MWVKVENEKVIYYGEERPTTGGDIFEWFGEPLRVFSPPLLDFPGIEASDDPRPEGYDSYRQDFEDLVDLASAEIDWLNNIIPNIPNMDLAQLRTVLARLAAENRYMLKAWRYLLNRLG